MTGDRDERSLRSLFTHSARNDTFKWSHGTLYVRTSVSLTERVKQHDSKTARRAVFVAALLLIAVGVGLLLVWATPSNLEKRRVITRACFARPSLQSCPGEEISSSSSR